MSNPVDPSERAAEFVALFRKGAEFSHELIQENQRLRLALAEVESRQNTAAQSNTEWAKLRSELLERIQGLEVERADAMERLAKTEEENHQFVSRYLEVEEENNNLANLYVSSYRLHATLDLSETLNTVLEIVINLIGAERFAVYAVDEKTGRLEAVAAEGGRIGEFPAEEAGAGPIGACLETGEIAYPAPPGEAEPGQPVVCIPLLLQERRVGCIAIFSLLQQKEGFTPLDHELFSLLAGHAATAIFASQLHGQSERKLNTIQGFLDLLTK
jgi:nitrate/nitrite-specific signal transduction histidine kinase